MLIRAESGGQEAEKFLRLSVHHLVSSLGQSALWARWHCNPQFTDRETEVQ